MSEKIYKAMKNTGALNIAGWNRDSGDRDRQRNPADRFRAKSSEKEKGNPALRDF